MTRRVPAIPQVRVSDPNAQRVLETLKQVVETREGVHDPLDKAVTLRELMELGIVSVDRMRPGAGGANGGAGVVVSPGESTPDPWAYTPPPEVTDLTVRGMFSTLMLEWTSPDYERHAYFEIWRASALESEPVPAFGDATLVQTIANGPCSDAVDATGDDRLYYYWVRTVSTYGLRSDPVGPVSDKLSLDPSYVMSLLLGKLGSDQMEGITGTPYLIEVPEAIEVDGRVIQPGVYMQSAFIQHASISGAQIKYAEIEDAHIVALTVDKLESGELRVGRTIQVSGAIFGGKTAYGSSVAGFWLGKDTDNEYRFAIGDGTSFLRWTGDTLDIAGNLVAGEIKAGVSIEAPEVIGGEVRYGKTAFADTTSGYWLGVDVDNVGKLHIGDAAQYVKWDGETLTVRATIDASVFTAARITGSTLDNSNTLIGPRYILDGAQLGGGMLTAVYGQPLDDVTTVPQWLAYPAFMRDVSMGTIESGVSGSYFLPAPSMDSDGDAGAPSTGNELKVRIGGGVSTVGGLKSGMVLTEFRNPAKVSSPGFAHRRVRLGAVVGGVGDDPDNYYRAAGTTATLRIRITDQARYNPADPTADGTSPAPWWCGAGGTGMIPNTNPYSVVGVAGALTLSEGRVFQVFVYPPFYDPAQLVLSPPDDDLSAVSQDAFTRTRDTAAGGLGINAAASVGADVAHPVYKLDLSSLSLYASGITVNTLNLVAYTAVEPIGNSGTIDMVAYDGSWSGQNPGTESVATATGSVRYRASALWKQTNPTVGTTTVTDDGWTITATYAGPGGQISVVAERQITLDDPRQALGYASMVRIGALQNTWSTALLFSTFRTLVQRFGYQATFDWPYLSVVTEIEVDNRPFTNDVVELP